MIQDSIKKASERSFQELVTDKGFIRIQENYFLGVFGGVEKSVSFSGGQMLLFSDH